MSWRTVVIRSRAKLELKLDYLFVRGETNQKIHVSEINVLIIESTAVALTAALLAELVKNRVKVIFCDQKHNPQSELMALSGNYQNSKQILAQINWEKTHKDGVWRVIVQQKIVQQQRFLLDEGKNDAASLLASYVEGIKTGDTSNREAHAAKVYFNALFGLDFIRGGDDSVNSALNYGYAVLLSAFNREVTANGFLTQLGVSHHNQFNPFNFSSDLMEPFRILVDRQVLAMQPTCFEHPEKNQLANLLNRQVTIDDKRYYLTQAITLFCRSVFESLSRGDPSLVKAYEL